MLRVSWHEIRERKRLEESLDTSEFEQGTEDALDELTEQFEPELPITDCDERGFELPSTIQDEPGA